MPTRTKPKTITQYIKAAPKAAQPKLMELRACLRKAAPGAEESLKWGLPAFSYDRILFTFAARKDHVGFYPTPSAVKAHAQDLTGFKTGKSTIQFPFERPLPLSLIRKVAAFRVRELKEKDARWM
jgi:uncharacterized protein YdhG (YjbR/CyaY superfamily)